MAGGTGGRAFAALPLSVLEQNGVGPGAQALCVDQLYANVALAAVDGQVVAGKDQILAGLAAVVVFIAVLALLIHHSGQKVQQEYALDSSGAKGYVVGG